MSVDRGQQLRIACGVQVESEGFVPSGTFTWTGPAVESDRTSIVNSATGTTSQLTIRNVMLQDDGMYSCSRTGLSTISFNLTVEGMHCRVNVAAYYIYWVSIATSKHSNKTVGDCSSSFRS